MKYNFIFSIRSGGHSYESYSICDGIVIDLSKLTNIDINLNDKTVTLGHLGPVSIELSKNNFIYWNLCKYRYPLINFRRLVLDF